MKKIFSIVAISLFALTLTGCGNKITEVICTTSGEAYTGEFTYTEKSTFTLKGNKVIKYFSENTRIYESESHANTMAQDLKLSAAKNKINGINYEYQANGNELYAKVTVVLEDITDKEIIKDTYLTKKREALIKELETTGATCK